jgi:pSer/pThr/pTyr-binding forkhead associated (FHA) protein
VKVTLRCLDGADQGRLFKNLATPITIGREEGNSIQLNDERVSRFHVKIQADNDKIILTDLESTNGTKVNGEEIRLRILRFGDLISVGRSLLLYGSENQIAGRLAELRGGDVRSDLTIAPGEVQDASRAGSLDFELSWANDPDVQATLHALQQPDLPEGLSPGQAAQLSELLEYLHIRLNDLIETVHAVDEAAERITLDQRQWQKLLDLQARISQYLREIAEPPEF